MSISEECLTNESKDVEVTMFTLLRPNGTNDLEHYLALEFPIETTHVDYEFYSDSKYKNCGSTNFNRSGTNNSPLLCFPFLKGKYCFLKCSFQYKEIEFFNFDFFDFFKIEEQVNKSITFQKHHTNTIRLDIGKKKQYQNDTDKFLSRFNSKSERFSQSRQLKRYRDQFPQRRVQFAGLPDHDEQQIDQESNDDVNSIDEVDEVDISDSDAISDQFHRFNGSDTDDN